MGGEFKTDKKSIKVTLTQVGVTNKVLNKVVVLDISNKITPVAKMILVTDADESSFDKPWEYDSVVGMLMYLYRNSRPDKNFAVHQCARFTHNPDSSHAEAIKRIFQYMVGIQGIFLNFDPNSDIKLY